MEIRVMDKPKDPSKVSSDTSPLEQDRVWLDLYTLAVDQHAILTRTLSILTGQVLQQQKKRV